MGKQGSAGKAAPETKTTDIKVPLSRRKSPKSKSVGSKMAKILLITDSNFLNNIGAFGGRRIKDVEVKACKSRKAVMQELSAVGEGVVVISCLDMVASDIARSNEGGSGADNAIEFYFNQIL